MDRKTAEEKARKLVSKMTIEEKASQLRYDAPAIKRLKIPAYNWWNEALHGVARAGTATVFPQAIAMAASFDPELLEKVGDAVSTEARAKYNSSVKRGDRDIYKGLTFWSPNVNIFRDPRWGRGHETYGEDPYLTSRMGAAYVKGLQGDGEYKKTAACAKHFAVHSGPEASRHEIDVKVSRKDLYETYLPAFEVLVKEAGVEAVMGAYNRVNGEPCCGSKTLIQDILRDKWKFKGHFVSDCWAIRDFHEHHGVTNSAKESAAMAIHAGCDLNCGNTYLHILKAYQDGLVTEEEITESAVRLFTTRYLLGMFDKTEYDSIPYTAVECEKHLELAERLAGESMVLLKNNGILPLKREQIHTIGVIGPNADSRAALMGNYYGTSSEYITLLEGIKREAGENIRVLYSRGCELNTGRTEHLAMADDRISEAAAVVEMSDVVILCMGLDETLEGEEGDEGNEYKSGDKKGLELPDCQRRLMEKILLMEKPVILCMMTGSAVLFGSAPKNADAILQLWYPGARGGKTAAEVLFGKTAPSGKLPITFYRSMKSLPDFEDYSMTGRTYRYLTEKPLYPFGYGLTYGKIQVTGAKVMQIIVDKVPYAVIRVKVINTGTVDCQEVVQVYIKNLDSKDAVKNHSLCAFTRISLSAGEEKVFDMELDKNSFTVVNEEGERLVDGSHYELYVGVSQPDARSIELTGMKPIRLQTRILVE